MLSININKLRSEVELREQRKIKIFEKILELCYQRILNSNEKNNEYTCTYIVPNVVFGLPLYNVNDCVTFIINKLIEKKFDVVFALPTTIHISWKPNNENNNYINNNYTNNNYTNNNKYKSLEYQKQYYNKPKTNLQLRTHAPEINKQNKQYKSINDYTQPKTIIYDENEISLFQSKLDNIFD